MDLPLAHINNTGVFEFIFFILGWTAHCEVTEKESQCAHLGAQAQFMFTVLQMDTAAHHKALTGGTSPFKSLLLDLW